MHQDFGAVPGTAESGDNLGYCLAHGDFDGDGFSDLAVGAWMEDVGAVADAGAVNVFYGSAGGLSDVGAQIWDQDQPGVNGGAEADDWFGSSLAAGDFNGDGFDDLAVGVPGEDVEAGAVNVLYGGAGGLSSAGDQWWNQDSAGVPGTAEPGDGFGQALAAGDFDGNGYADLAIGAPFEDIVSNTVPAAGAVNVLYGSALGLTSTGAQIWDQNKLAVAGPPGGSNWFGVALATGRFNTTSFDALVIGVPFDSVTGVNSEGSIVVLYGNFFGGLSDVGSQIFHQNTPGVQDLAEHDDRFGMAVTTGDFDGDGVDDVGIGIPGENNNASLETGAGQVLYSRLGQLSTTDAQFGFGVRQPAKGIENMTLGRAVTSGDYDGNGCDDFALGDPRWRLLGVTAAGGVRVVYGTPGGITLAGNNLWAQDTTIILDAGEAWDEFGWGLPQ